MTKVCPSSIGKFTHENLKVVINKRTAQVKTDRAFSYSNFITTYRMALEFYLYTIDTDHNNNIVINILNILYAVVK